MKQHIYYTEKVLINIENWLCYNVKMTIVIIRIIIQLATININESKTLKDGFTTPKKAAIAVEK